MGRMKIKNGSKKSAKRSKTYPIMLDKKTSIQSSTPSTIGGIEGNASGLKPFSEPNATDDLTIETSNCAASDVSQIVFTRESLERYAAWKKEWLKEQGLTEAEYEAGNEKFLRRLKFG